MAARSCGEEGRAARGIGLGEGQNLAEDDSSQHFLVPSPNVLWSCISAFPKDSVVKKKKKKIYNDSPRPPHPPDPIARSSRSPSSWGRNSG